MSVHRQNRNHRIVFPPKKKRFLGNILALFSHGWKSRTNIKVFAKRPHPFIWIAFLGFMIGSFLIIMLPEWMYDEIPEGIRVVPLSIHPYPLSQKALYERQVVIAPGDLLGNLLDRLKISSQVKKALLNFRDDKMNKGLGRKLFAHRSITARFDATGKWLWLDLDMDRKTFYRVQPKFNEDGTWTNLVGALWSKSEEWIDHVGGGNIDSSLFATLERNNISDNVAIKVANIFGTKIDFNREVYKNDEIWVAFRQLYIDGLATSEVRINAILFVNRKKKYYAFRFPLSKAQRNEDITHIAERMISDDEMETITNAAMINPASAFYDYEGQSVVTGFLRSPLEFTRISSSFNLRRFHPVLHKIRAHKGVDFAAPAGTKVRAVGDGVVTYRGKKGGFGNLVILSHANHIETRYAHLKGFAKGLRKGNKVVQTQVIGFVGKTGLATGYHLHYEFRVGGRPQDPLTVPIPAGRAVPKNQHQAFNKRRDVLAKLLKLAQHYPTIARE